MNHLANNRALARLELARHKRENSLMSVVLGAERLRKQRRRAALTLVKFAQVLAGTDQWPETPEPVREEPRLPPDHPFAAPSPPSRPVWGPNNRPGPHDVLTWEEVMQVPWIEGEESILR